MKKYIGIPVISLWLLVLPSCQKEILFSKYDYNSLGTSATDLLSASAFTSLLIEIHYMPGYPPDPTAISNLENFLTLHLNKPGGITILQSVTEDSQKQILNLTELVQTEKKVRSHYTSGNQIAVHILITDNDFSDPGILALSYWNTSTCLFGKTIYENSGHPGQRNRTDLFTALLQHEFGHLLGLVDQGSPMQESHRDESNGAHCSNRSCLMFHSVETAGNNPDIGNSAVPPLDDRCLADLRANGGK